MVAFVKLGRPLFLGGGFVLYALGAALALVAGAIRIDGRLYLLGQAAVTVFQLMTHYANDYFDYEADRANRTPTRWSGGSRVLANDQLPRAAALVAALVLLAAGLLLALVISWRPGTGPLVAPALVAIAVFAWAYSAPPLRLHSSGFGEVDVAVVVTGLVPFLGFHLQSPALQGLPLLLLAIVPLMLLQVAMLLAIEFPDQAGDTAVGKRTLLVRLGSERGARLYVRVLAAVYLVLPLLLALGLPLALALAAAAPIPLAAWRIRRIRAGDHRDPQCWPAVTFWAVALLVLTSAAELLAALWLRSRG